MTITTLSGWELAFAIPYSSDLQKNHLDVFRHLASRFPEWSHHDEDGACDSGRRVQFMTVSSESMKRSAALVRLTGLYPPVDVTDPTMREVGIEVATGVVVKFAITMSANAHIQVGSRRKQVPVDDADIPAFVQRRIAGIGLSPTSALSIRPMRGLFVGKAGRSFGVDAVAVSGHARVTDPEALTSAWVRGVGRQRTHGLGMLRILDVGDPS